MAKEIKLKRLGKREIKPAAKIEKTHAEAVPTAEAVPGAAPAPAAAAEKKERKKRGRKEYKVYSFRLEKSAAAALEEYLKKEGLRYADFVKNCMIEKGVINADR